MVSDNSKRIIDAINRINQLEKEKELLDKEIKTIQVNEWININGYVSSYWFNDYQHEYFNKLRRESLD